jgi:hypothetical protein
MANVALQKRSIYKRREAAGGGGDTRGWTAKSGIQARCTREASGASKLERADAIAVDLLHVSLQTGRSQRLERAHAAVLQVKDVGTDEEVACGNGGGLFLHMADVSAAIPIGKDLSLEQGRQRRGLGSTPLALQPTFRAVKRAFQPRWPASSVNH